MTEMERVFVIHGRDTSLYDYVLKVLKTIGVNTLTWTEAVRGTNATAPYTLDIVKYALKNSKIVLALMTPDEIVKLKKTHQNTNERDGNDRYVSEQARPNVIFEIGLLLGLAKAHQKIYVILCNQCRLLSDIHGINYIPFYSGQSEKFLHTLIEYLKAEGLTLENHAFDLSKGIDVPKTVEYSYLSLQSSDEDSVALVLKQRGAYNSYFEKLLASSEVKIVGVSQESILRHIRTTIDAHGDAFKKLKEKNIKILIAGNQYYTNLIDRIEDQQNRVLIRNNIRHAASIMMLKSTHQLDNLDIRMHLYANSCTIMIFDDVMWLTPYTHRGGSASPTFVVNSHENPDVYKFYQEYFDKLWRDAVSVSANDTEYALEDSLAKKKNELNLL